MYKILYVHGYGGTADGASSKLIKKMFSDAGIDVEIDAPSFPLDNPRACVELISKRSIGKDLVIGSSFGALMCMFLAGPRKLLINPAIPDDIRKLNVDYSEDTLKSLDADLNKLLNDYVDVEFKNSTYFIFGKTDVVAKNKSLIEKFYYADNIFELDMGHSMVESVAKDFIDVFNKLVEDKKHLFNWEPRIPDDLS